MKRALFLSALLVPSIAIAACSGGVVPVAQDAADGGSAGSSSGTSGTSSSGSSGASSSGSSGTSGASGSGSSGASSSGSSGALDGGKACPADAGGNSCFCGDLVCKDGQWTCGPCSTDGGAGTCSPACESGKVCVKDQVVGGAIVFPDDAGTCPAGRHFVADHCEQDPTYACAAYPSGCTGLALTCTCAASICTSQSSCSFTCESTSPGQVNCLCQTP